MALALQHYICAVGSCFHMHMHAEDFYLRSDIQYILYEAYVRKKRVFKVEHSLNDSD